MLQANELIISQSKIVGRDEFTISDSQGQSLGTARQTLKLSDLVKASRGVEVFDAAGTLVLAIEDPINLIRDRYVVHGVDPHTGAQMELAHITKKLAWIGAKYEVDIVGFPPVEIVGEVFQLNYALNSQGRTIARVDAEFSGVGRALLGKTTYRVSLEHGLDASVHAAVIGIALALDMRRQKLRDG